MRKLATAIATAATLGLMAFSAPASADDSGHRGDNQHKSNQYEDEDAAYRGQGQWNDRGRNVHRRFDFGRHQRSFDSWERGWGHQGFGEFRNHRTLSYARLVRRLAAQGYYGIRGLRGSNVGFGWRAFAFNHRGQPVMLRINPYTGRVLNARLLHASY